MHSAGPLRGATSLRGETLTGALTPGRRCHAGPLRPARAGLAVEEPRAGAWGSDHARPGHPLGPATLLRGAAFRFAAPRLLRRATILRSATTLRPSSQDILGTGDTTAWSELRLCGRPRPAAQQPAQAQSPGPLRGATLLRRARAFKRQRPECKARLGEEPRLNRPNVLG